MTHAQIVERLLEARVPRQTACLYADAFLEYQEAIANIRRNGTIVAHPRTHNPIENPYLSLRDRARKTLLDFRLKAADFLWQLPPETFAPAADPPPSAKP